MPQQQEMKNEKGKKNEMWKLNTQLFICHVSFDVFSPFFFLILQNAIFIDFIHLCAHAWINIYFISDKQR